MKKWIVRETYADMERGVLVRNVWRRWTRRGALRKLRQIRRATSA